LTTSDAPAIARRRHELAYVTSAAAYPGSTTAFLLVNRLLISCGYSLMIASASYLGLEWAELAAASTRLANLRTSNQLSRRALVAALTLWCSTTVVLTFFSVFIEDDLNYLWLVLANILTVIAYVQFAISARRMQEVFHRSATARVSRAPGGDTDADAAAETKRPGANDRTSRTDRMLAREVLMKWTVRCLLSAAVANFIMGFAWLASIALGGDYAIVWAMHLIYLLCAAVAQMLVGGCLISFALIATRSGRRAVFPSDDEAVSAAEHAYRSRSAGRG